MDHDGIIDYGPEKKRDDAAGIPGSEAAPSQPCLYLFVFEYFFAMDIDSV
jgi:hypothetical protein